MSRTAPEAAALRRASLRRHARPDRTVGRTGGLRSSAHGPESSHDVQQAV